MKSKYFVLMLLLCISFVFAATSTPVATLTFLNQNPDPVVAGSIVEVSVRVQNAGTVEIKNIEIGFEPNYPFSAVPGEPTTKSILSLPAWAWARRTPPS